MALIFDWSTSIPLSLTKKPSGFSAVTPKVHFCGFNLSLYSLILLKNFLRLVICPPSIHGFHYHVINIYCASSHVTDFRFMFQGTFGIVKLELRTMLFSGKVVKNRISLQLSNFQLNLNFGQRDMIKILKCVQI